MAGAGQSLPQREIHNKGTLGDGPVLQRMVKIKLAVQIECVVLQKFVWVKKGMNGNVEPNAEIVCGNLPAAAFSQEE